jgi:hypothetical protein
MAVELVGMDSPRSAVEKTQFKPSTSSGMKPLLVWSTSGVLIHSSAASLRLGTLLQAVSAVARSAGGSAGNKLGVGDADRADGSDTSGVEAFPSGVPVPAALHAERKNAVLMARTAPVILLVGWPSKVHPFSGSRESTAADLDSQANLLLAARSKVAIRDTDVHSRAQPTRPVGHRRPFVVLSFSHKDSE